MAGKFKVGSFSRRLPVGTTLVSALLAAASISAHGQASLATVVDLAQKNSTSVRIAEANVQKAQAQLSESRDVVIPSLLFSTGLPVFPEVGFTGQIPSIWSASTQSLVFSMSQIRYINAARLGLRSTLENLKDAREQVALDASTTYIELDTVNRELQEVARQESFAAKLVEIEQQRSEAGVDPLNDYLEAQLTGANIKLRRMHLEARSATLAAELAMWTGLPAGSLVPDHSSIPEIPQVRGDHPGIVPGISSAQLLADSRQLVAKGDREVNYMPQLSFGAQYFRETNLLNNVNQYFNSGKGLPANNFSSGISITVPLFGFEQRAKARESAADALRARVEAEQAQKQNDVQVAELTGSIRELETLAEIASLKQQIADERLKTVMTELQLGNGSGSGPGSTPQASPRLEQQARIDGNQKLQDAMDAGFDLAKARLGLLRSLGHMGDWLRELNVK